MILLGSLKNIKYLGCLNNSSNNLTDERSSQRVVLHDFGRINELIIHKILLYDAGY